MGAVGAVLLLGCSSSVDEAAEVDTADEQFDADALLEQSVEIVQGELDAALAQPEVAACTERVAGQADRLLNDPDRDRAFLALRI